MRVWFCRKGGSSIIDMVGQKFNLFQPMHNVPYDDRPNSIESVLADLKIHYHKAWATGAKIALCLCISGPLLKIARGSTFVIVTPWCSLRAGRSAACLWGGYFLLGNRLGRGRILVASSHGKILILFPYPQTPPSPLRLNQQSSRQRFMSTLKAHNVKAIKDPSAVHGY